MIHGVLNVYKEKGYTSHDVVAKLRGITRQKKIGHTGTLDPDAVGVLPICLGRATKLCDLLTDKDKTYEAVLLLGRETDTQDISGKVIEEKNTEYLEESQVTEAILSFLGEYDQIPPMYSALKVGGKKLYELAREGKTVERKARRVQIYSLQVVEMNLPRVKIKVECSKGTYIRTLCHDIGRQLGCGGCMEKLTRTKVSRFEIKDSVTLEEITKKKEEDKLEMILTPIDAMFPDYPKAVVKKRWEQLAYNGNVLYAKAVQTEETGNGSKIADKAYIRLYDEEEQFIALYQYTAAKDEYSIVKMFYNQKDK